MPMNQAYDKRYPDKVSKFAIFEFSILTGNAS